MTFRGATLSTSWGKRPIAPIVAEGLEVGTALAARAGFDAIELSGDPTEFDRTILNGALKASGVQLSGIMTGAVNGTLNDRCDTLTSPEPEARAACAKSISGAIDLASDHGALVSIGLGVGDGPRAMLCDMLGPLAAGAEARGIRLCLEPVNRYLNSSIRTVAEALAVINDVGAPALGITLDLFQANIEERSIVDAIREAGPHLVHIQLADNTRRAPGTGSLDFGAVRAALGKVGYAGWLSAEQLPDPSPEAAAAAWITFYREFLTMPDPLTLSEFEILAGRLNADPIFQERAAHFRGEVGLSINGTDWVVSFDGGQITGVRDGLMPSGADIRFHAPKEEWDALLAGESHLIKALNPFHGKMSVEGKAEVLATNMRPIFYLFSALKDLRLA